MPFNMFPYSNLHNFNLDWILNTVKQIADSVSQFADNLKHVVCVTAQTFTAEEQRIACNNIKAVSYLSQSSLPADRTIARANLQAVGYEAQTLTETQQTAARDNIGAASASDIPDVSDVVRYSPQDLTLTEQTRARLNINATSQDDVTLLLATKHYVKYDEQNLTGAQKAQARTNIDAGSAVDVQTNANEIQAIHGELNNLYPLVVTFSGTTANGNAACDKTWSAISEAITAGRPLTVRYTVPPTPPGVEDTVYILSAVIGNGLSGKYLDISDPTNPGDAYTYIYCTLLPDNTVRCHFLNV